MTTKTPTVAPARVHSHHVTLTNDERDVAKEQVFLTFLTEWRGQPAAVTMQADRYRAGMRGDEHLTDWRVYAYEARGRTDEADRFGPHLTDTARQRLGDAAEPAVLDWLNGAELADADGAPLPVYLESSRRAIVRALAHNAGELGVTRGYTGDRIRRMADTWRGVCGADAADALHRMADALDQAQAAYATLTA